MSDCNIIRPEIFKTIARLYEVVEDRERKVWTRKRDLLYHKRRKRVKLHEWVRELGPDGFYIHHQMRRVTYEKLSTKLRYNLQTDSSKVRSAEVP